MYQQVYLAVIAALLIASLITFAFFRYVVHPSTRNTAAFATLTKLVSEALPPLDASKAAQASVIQDWIHRTRAEVALYGPDRQLIFGGGKRIPAAPPASQVEDGWIPGEASSYAAVLPDKRWLVVAVDGHGDRITFGFALFLIALLVGLSVYPVVRKITRRLENLQQIVATFGGGDLAARADITGTDEVGMLARSFNHSAGQLEALVKAQQSLLANASHELRSPLARLQMALGLMGTEGESTAIEEISRNIRELDQLIDEILLASRLDSPNAMQGLRLESIDLHRLLRDDCAGYGAAFSGDQAQVVGNRILLQRMVRNLLENARRYGAGAPVEVRASRLDDARIEISVWDRGPGVPASEMERIFEPFYRVPGAKESAGGVGLGLSLVRSIAAQHGGTACCMARSGGGSGFLVCLPLNGVRDAHARQLYPPLLA
jgi:signal transduction histidine kinase